MYAHEKEAFARRARQARAGYPTRGGASLAAGASPATGTRSGPSQVPSQRSRGQQATRGPRAAGERRTASGHPAAGTRSRAGEQRAQRDGAALTVAPPEPVPVPRTAFVVLVLVVVAAGVVGILLLNTKVNENAFRLDDLRQTQAELDQREQELEEQVAQARSPSQLAEAARRLGLVRAEEKAYLRLPDGEVLHEAVPGVTASQGGADGVDPAAEGGAAGPGAEG